MVIGSLEAWLVCIADVYVELDCRSRVASAAVKRDQKYPKWAPNGTKSDQK